MGRERAIWADYVAIKPRVYERFFDESEPILMPMRHANPKKASGAVEGPPRIEHQSSPLKYKHGWPVERLALIDPAAPPSPPGHPYFAKTKHRVPAAGPGVVAFLDYHILPGTGGGMKIVETTTLATGETVRKRSAPEQGRTDAVYIDYITTRDDQQGRGHMRALVGQLYADHPQAAWIDWGEIYSAEVARLWKRYRDLAASGLVPETAGKPLR